MKVLVHKRDVSDVSEEERLLHLKVGSDIEYERTDLSVEDACTRLGNDVVMVRLPAPTDEELAEVLPAAGGTSTREAARTHGYVLWGDSITYVLLKGFR